MIHENPDLGILFEVPHESESSSFRKPSPGADGRTVGDRSNHLPMIDITGPGIAFHAKPMVKKSAQESISSMGWMPFFY